MASAKTTAKKGSLLGDDSAIEVKDEPADMDEYLKSSEKFVALHAKTSAPPTPASSLPSSTAIRPLRPPGKPAPPLISASGLSSSRPPRPVARIPAPSNSSIRPPVGVTGPPVTRSSATPINSKKAPSQESVPLTGARQPAQSLAGKPSTVAASGNSKPLPKAAAVAANQKDKPVVSGKSVGIPPPPEAKAVSGVSNAKATASAASKPEPPLLSISTVQASSSNPKGILPAISQKLGAAGKLAADGSSKTVSAVSRQTGQCTSSSQSKTVTSDTHKDTLKSKAATIAKTSLVNANVTGASTAAKSVSNCQQKAPVMIQKVQMTQSKTKGVLASTDPKTTTLGTTASLPSKGSSKAPRQSSGVPVDQHSGETGVASLQAVAVASSSGTAGPDSISRPGENLGVSLNNDSTDLSGRVPNLVNSKAGQKGGRVTASEDNCDSSLLEISIKIEPPDELTGDSTNILIDKTPPTAASYSVMERSPHGGTEGDTCKEPSSSVLNSNDESIVSLGATSGLGAGLPALSALSGSPDGGSERSTVASHVLELSASSHPRSLLLRGTSDGTGLSTGPDAGLAVSASSGTGLASSACPNAGSGSSAGQNADSLLCDGSASGSTLPASPNAGSAVSSSLQSSISSYRRSSMTVDMSIVKTEQMYEEGQLDEEQLPETLQTTATGNSSIRTEEPTSAIGRSDVSLGLGTCDDAGVFPSEMREAVSNVTLFRDGSVVEKSVNTNSTDVDMECSAGPPDAPVGMMPASQSRADEISPSCVSVAKNVVTLVPASYAETESEEETNTDALRPPDSSALESEMDMCTGRNDPVQSRVGPVAAQSQLCEKAGVAAIASFRTVTLTPRASSIGTGADGITYSVAGNCMVSIANTEKTRTSGAADLAPTSSDNLQKKRNENVLLDRMEESVEDEESGAMEYVMPKKKKVPTATLR